MTKLEFDEIKIQSNMSDAEFEHWLKTSGLFEESLRQEMLEYLGEING